MYTKIETITPERAKAILENNPDNRRIRNDWVATLVREMKNGTFVCTHQGIAISEDGRVLDGQHRLVACALSGCPITVSVTYDMPLNYMEYVDTGIARKYSDQAKLIGKHDDDPVLRHSMTTGFVRALFSLGYNSAIKLSFSEIDAFIEKHRDAVLTVAKNMKRGGSSSAINAAALAAILCGESAKDINAFYRVFLQGDASDSFGYNTAAAFNLSRQVLSAKAKHLTIGNKKLFNMTQNGIWQFLRNSSTVTTIKETKALRYPVEDILQEFVEAVTRDADA